MDPRVVRSRAQLQDALLALAREHALDDITIADITTRAAVNRSTFYQHYDDKATLLADALEQAVDAATASLLERHGSATTGAMPTELLAYLEHIRDNAALYRRVLGDHGSAVVASRLRGHIGALAAELVGQMAPNAFPGVPADVVGESLAGTAMGVATAWIRRDPVPPVEEAAQWLWSVLTGAVTPTSAG
ncbi:TetR/AcrR family transcriptional regulator [Microbacterium gorillae]|uniref:TetR/AcrR family transcriptional regulator n=1 Tax=Microbacterium gorillae TaxID=1231063 RepID=UPI00058D1974|nr:TetR family transcriptional regulator [Microbacterium gorillae]